MSYKISVKDLASSNAHFGHKKSKRHPNTNFFIWGKKNGAHLIDLEKSSFMIEKACKYLEDLFAKRGGQALWLGTKRQAKKTIAGIGSKMKQPAVINRWIGGTFTNYDQVQKAVTRLLHMNDVVAKPLPYQKKKEIAALRKEAERLDKNVGGLVDMKSMPKALIVVDAKREATAIKEASRCGIPVIALVDTNSSTNLIDVVIPCNDDSPKSIELVFAKLLEAVENGLKTFAAHEKVRIAENKKKAEEQKKKVAKDIEKEGKASVRPVRKPAAKSTATAKKVAAKDKVVEKEEVKKEEPAKAAKKTVAKKTGDAKSEVADKKPKAKVATKPMATKKATATKKAVSTKKSK